MCVSCDRKIGFVRVTVYYHSCHASVVSPTSVFGALAQRLWRGSNLPMLHGHRSNRGKYRAFRFYSMVEEVFDRAIIVIITLLIWLGNIGGLYKTSILPGSVLRQLLSDHVSHTSVHATFSLFTEFLQLDLSLLHGVSPDHFHGFLLLISLVIHGGHF